MPTSRDDRLRDVLRQRFGLAEFRPDQEQVIRSVLDGKDVIAVMPTGFGKSLLYQLPSILLPRLTVVVSPLIALMKDQTDKLEELGVEASTIHSGLTDREQDAAEEAVPEGRGLLYVTPERFRDRDFFEMLRARGVSLLVVDEAHCVSHWGHDFRPDYLTLGDVAERLGRPPILALTATAPPDVQDDIIAQLAMRDPHRAILDPSRPNLFFEVLKVPSPEKKDEIFEDALDGCEGTGIVYVATVKEAERLHAKYRERWPLALYHGKRGRRERSAAQEAFMAGQVKAVIATNAFGLGIDKPDIRFVIHYHMPGSPESYYQEAGRAGRDGQPAMCTVLYQDEDQRVQKYFLGGRYPSLEETATMARAIQRLPRGRERALEDIAAAAEVGQRKARIVLMLLKRAGAVREHRGGSWSRSVEDVTRVDLSAALDEWDERRDLDRERLSAMIGYCRSAKCRTRNLLEYLGATVADGFHCGHCDNDLIPDVFMPVPDARAGDDELVFAFEPESPEAGAAFTQGDKVRHAGFGEGTVRAVRGERVDVRFGKRVRTIQAGWLTPA